MRTIIISIFMLMGIPIIAYSQEQDDPYFPMLQDGKKWVTVLESGSEVIHYIDGDTLIDGLAWKRVFSKFNVQDYCYFGAIRQEQDKVYGIIAGKEEPYLFYDFGLQVGDTITCRGKYFDNFGFVYYIGYKGSHAPVGFFSSSENNYNIQTRPEIPEIAIQTVTVENIDTIQVRGREFRRFTLKNFYLLKAPSDTPSFQYPYFVWVEGIGCEGGLFVSGRKIGPWTQLYCMMDDMVIFEYDDFHVPGISDGINPVPAPMLEDTNLYDLTGRRLTAPPARGIYIRNGRKYVVK